jgi:phage gpG-like protein
MASAPRDPGAVRVEGLRELRRDARRMEPAVGKELRAVIKSAAHFVAEEARILAPRKTGKLAASIRATTSGDRGVVRSPLPYAGVQEYGGTIRPSGVPIHIKRHEFVARALDRQRDKVVDALGDGIERAARHNGWR